jgi:hypothetical protein
MKKAALLVKIIMVSVVGVFIISICGCASKKQTTLFGRVTPRTEQLSKEELREALNNFEEFAFAATTDTANKLKALSPEYRSQKTNLVQTTRSRHAIHTMLEHQEPIVAYIETWGLCVRVKNYLKYGEGSMLYRQYQDMVISHAEMLQSEIELIGKRFLRDDVYAKNSKDIYAFAAANPITGIFSNLTVYATKVEPGKKGLFEDVISVPMSPFKAMAGVDRTASAIYDVRDSANRFSDVVEEFPESTRTQMLFLLMEMGETEIVKSLLDNVSTFSDSSARFADTAEVLPERLSVLISELDEKQANLQITLEKTKKTSAAIGHAMIQADKAAISFQAAANDINQVATVWEKAAISTTEVLEAFNSLKTPGENEDADPRPSYSLIDFANTVDAVGQTVTEMQELTNKVYAIVESEQLDKHASIPGELANLLAWRLAQLIFLTFALAFVYRFIVIRVLNKSK